MNGLCCSGIYVIINLINKKMYVGASKDVGKRWNGHKEAMYKKSHNHYPLYVDMKKYGARNFIIALLEIVPDYTQLKSKEEYWIKKLETIKEDIGYNIEISREGSGSYESKYVNDNGNIIYKRNRSKTGMPDEHRQYISNYMKRIWAERKARGEEFKAGMVGRKHSPEAKAKMRKTHIDIIQKKREDDSKNMDQSQAA